MRSAELSEAAWARIEPLMPQAEGRSRPWREHRQDLGGVDEIDVRLVRE
jgi:transposase